MSVVTDCRQPFGAALERLAEDNPRIVAVTNDSVGSSNLTSFRKRFPQRFVNVGIAEQNLIGTGVGLANSGLLPFVCGAACFLTGRALEQIKIDLGYGRANVKLCGMSSGVAYGPLGPTHHSAEDLAWTRVIPNLVLIAPADGPETAQAVEAAARIEGPVFLRISRMPVPDVHSLDYQFEPGRAALLREGSDVTIIAVGTMVSRALDASDLLAAEGIAARVLNMATIKPLDRDAIVRAAEETGAIVTVEEHSAIGGLGGAVAEATAATHPVPVHILGIPGVFAPTGSPAWLLEHFGLTAEGIRAAAAGLVARRRNA
ncbi:MAG: transketolase family protein [Bryobacteraceae bacterium]|nr:transketolase family protein [Bryobacteraceae bacterium]